jgi:GNAT superfamily N-acetyltransferase
MAYKVDKQLQVDEFLNLANEVWPGSYDRKKVELALSKTINITARKGGKLIGCVRLLTDGYFMTTIPEAFVLPDYQEQGIGSALFELAKEVSPTSLFFGAQPDKEPFYNKLGFKKSLQSFQYKKPRD